ncbi:MULTISPECIES: acetaldehyde dehydrogenase (acetylating) [unclassified Beijerinckia]|uniref:acetaldehyde dehydrogenase (acetylating) n=1 Tax=unclassified Beijerinckia TaxID=2638183 RepID=UPI0008986175|nr:MULTISPECIES: acetaldehyde dehydrogenase (acetylating) [unclassified Beijerinckia]MDH7796012.1 acetaldehyde dehydrogenase [Beijerinckia sp. GAS462]SEC26315.1 acetaldehyde dehydrogenase [Beijerinckia sp. 28-YEA-48]
MGQIKVAIIGSGNIGTDLMVKIMRHGAPLEMAMLVGIDPASEGLARAGRLGVAHTAHGIDGLLESPDFKDIRIVFDATSAGAHQRHADLLRPHSKILIDLTPAALGPFVVPVVNLEAHVHSDNLNMVTCGGQATIPIVAAVNSQSPVVYAEIVASIASKSAGPGTRANIDEFTETTARAIEQIGGAQRGKAIIILNPAEPPVLMRDTVYCLTRDGEPDQIARAVEDMVAKVAAYVPGYRLKQSVQFERISNNSPVRIPGVGDVSGLKTSVFLEVEGAAHYLPSYAGNLDIMTSAAMTTARNLALRLEANHA